MTTTEPKTGDLVGNIAFRHRRHRFLAFAAQRAPIAFADDYQCSDYFEKLIGEGTCDPLDPFSMLDCQTLTAVAWVPERDLVGELRELATCQNLNDTQTSALIEAANKLEAGAK